MGTGAPASPTNSIEMTLMTMLPTMVNFVIHVAAEGRFGADRYDTLSLRVAWAGA